MGEKNYKYGCKKCGRYVEVSCKAGILDGGSFDDNDIVDQLNKICICKK